MTSLIICLTFKCTLPCVSVLGQIYVLLLSLHTTEPYQLELYCRQIIPVLILTDSFHWTMCC